MEVLEGGRSVKRSHPLLNQRDNHDDGLDVLVRCHCHCPSPLPSPIVLVCCPVSLIKLVLQGMMHLPSKTTV